MCEMAKKTALVVGALGVVGRAMLTYLETLPDWDVIGVSRRLPDFPTKARFKQLDLTEAAACMAVSGMAVTSAPMRPGQGRWPARPYVLLLF
jgi:nucleoside-diphosphate-sugar epimerase